MQIVILAGFAIVLTIPNSTAPTASAHLGAPLVVLYLLGVVCLARTNTVMSLRVLERGGRTFAAAMKRNNLLTILTQLWLVGGLAGVTLVGYGPWVGQTLARWPVPLLDEAALLAPFLAGVTLVWILDYPFHRVRMQWADPPGRQADAGAATSRPGWSRRQYVTYSVRHHLLFVAVPVALMLLVKDCLDIFVCPRLPEGLADTLLPAGMIASAATVFLLAPLLIVHVWKTRRLGDGELRRELEASCRRFGLKYRDIRVWESGGVIINAGVMGIAAPVRYILLSDGLLERMDRRDVEAIFAHEAGHILQHHIFYAALFAVGTIGLAASLVELLGRTLSVPSWALDTIAICAMGVILGFGFGALSRRFERQSDVIGAWASGRRGENDDPDVITHEGAAVFARALQRVAELSGIPLTQRNWRHGSIAGRIRYVLYLGSTAGTRRRDDRVVRRLKLLIWAIATAGAAAVAGTMALQ